MVACLKSGVLVTVACFRFFCAIASSTGLFGRRDPKKVLVGHLQCMKKIWNGSFSTWHIISVVVFVKVLHLMVMSFTSH